MRKTLFLVFITFCSTLCYSQKTYDYTHPDRLFLDAKEQYDLEHYSAAFYKFNKYIESQTKDRSPLYGQTEYYLASCAYEMGDKNAGKYLQVFLRNNPTSTFVNRAHYLNGSLSYNKASYADATKEYELVDPERLKVDEKADYLFRSGYSYLQQGQVAKAKEKFAALMADSTKYNQSALYYKAYIDYLNKDYDEALSVFEKLKEESEYSSIVPYYIFQIQYAKKDYDAVLSSGEQLLQANPDNENNKEVQRILGECYYQKKDYKNTAKYLSLYQANGGQVIRNNMYMLGISYYQEGDFVKAIDCFQSVASVEDALGQNAYLYLGSCYVKDENLNNARLCFESAGRMDFDKNVKEEAKYNYALIVYEQAYSPFNESINAFESFLDEFKSSRYRDKVHGYMVNLYMTTKNYSEALKSIEKIENKSLMVYEARQRINYNLGIQSINNSDYKEAIQYFNESLKDGKYDAQTESEATFWRGETYYRMKDYANATKDFSAFVSSPGARACNEYNLGHYNMGYSYFTQKDYVTALGWFRKYLDLEKENKTLIADATNRIGDCYFNQKDYDKAAKSYANVYSMKGPGADYACFQQGFIQGLQKDYNGKVTTLNKLISTFPQSEYISDAKYEIGRSYVMMGDAQKAIDTYDKLNAEYPHSPLSRKGKLQTAMLYEEMDKTEQAKNTYKEIVKYFPTSVESKTAIESLKNLYFEQNDVQGFADYVNSLDGLAKFDQSEQDSLTYMAAERLYDMGQYEKAATSFQNYLEKFPNSFFVPTAHFNLGNCYYRLNKMDLAEKEYGYMATQVGSSEREEALVRLSEIQYNNQDYAKAIASMSVLDSIAQNAENKLAARIGLLRCNNLLGKTDETIEAANTIVNSDKLDPNVQREALYVRAKAYEVKGDSASAIKDFTTLSYNCMDEYGAEGKYRVAESYYLQANYAKAEKEVFDFIDVNTPHQYWLAKSFILLSDVYVKLNRDFEAKQYLISVRENYSGKDDISSEIKVRLAQIEARESEKVVKE